VELVVEVKVVLRRLTQNQELIIPDLVVEEQMPKGQMQAKEEKVLSSSNTLFNL
jgi:hypothetical protein